MEQHALRGIAMMLAEGRTSNRHLQRSMSIGSDIQTTEISKVFLIFEIEIIITSGTRQTLNRNQIRRVELVSVRRKAVDFRDAWRRRVGFSIRVSGKSELCIVLPSAIRISHERGNTRAADHSEDATVDHFYFKNWSSEKKRSYVEAIVDEMLDGAGGATTVGDVSLANSPLMETALQHDGRVIVTVQLREKKSWIKSVLSVGAGGGLVEMHQMRNLGISAADGDRERRLGMMMDHVHKEAKRLRAIYGPTRVMIVFLDQLDIQGNIILKTLGLKQTWDCKKGRNAVNESRLFKMNHQAKKERAKARVMQAMKSMKMSTKMKARSMKARSVKAMKSMKV